LKELNEERNKNNNLLKELNEERNKSKNLLEQLNNEKIKVEELTNKINKSENTDKENLEKIKELEGKIKELEETIKMKDLEIKNNNKINTTSTISEGKTISLLFTSIDQRMNRPVSCKTTDSFVKIEEKVYNEIPEYKDYNTFLTVNGKLIKRFKTFEENGIKDGNIILVNILED
jgi:chromosome segregation ATPase